MTQASRIPALQKQHAALWYGFASYRLAWLVLPQALVALVIGIFFLGGALPGFPMGGKPDPARAKNEWAKPADTETAEAELNKLRDGVGDNSAPDGKAVLEKLAKEGNALASFKLATLYDPYFSKLFPYPPEKDPIKALELYQPSADEGFNKAFANIGNLQLWQNTPHYDPVNGCKAIRTYLDAPEMAPGTRDSSSVQYMLMAANCYAEQYREPGTPPLPVSATDARLALDLYQDPLMLELDTPTWEWSTPDPRMAEAELYLNKYSPVYDLTKGCDLAKRWVNRLGAQSAFTNPSAYWALGQAAYCFLGSDGRRSTKDYMPTPENEKIAAALLDQPIMQEQPFAASIRTWFYLNGPHSLLDTQKGCDAALKWASLTQGEQAEIDALTDWLKVRMSECLTGFTYGTAPITSTAEQSRIAKTMLEEVAGKNDPDAIQTLAKLYDWGSGGWPRDPQRSLDYYQQCAALGEPDCYRGTAEYKKYGIGGTPKDLVAAVQDYQVCAKAGFAYCHAQIVDSDINLPPAYQLGDAELLAHLKQAVEGKNDLAMTLYAIAYFDGLYGLTADKEAAAKWFINAIATSSNGQQVDVFAEQYAPKISDKSFWKAFHSELTRRNVYDGKIASTMPPETLDAARKLSP